MSGKLTLKIYYAGEIRRIVFDSVLCGGSLYGGLVRRVRSSIPMELKTADLYWKDEENDFILLKTDDEVKEAMNSAKDGILKLYIMGKEDLQRPAMSNVSSVIVMEEPVEHAATGASQMDTSETPQLTAPADISSAAAAVDSSSATPPHDTIPTVAGNSNLGASETPETGVGSEDSDNNKGLCHNGVLCDGCDCEIYGLRYKCVICEDYDLCDKCRPVGTSGGQALMSQEGHSSLHPMMLLPTPNSQKQYPVVRQFIRRMTARGSVLVSRPRASETDDRVRQPQRHDEPFVEHTLVGNRTGCCAPSCNCQRCCTKDGKRHTDAHSHNANKRPKEKCDADGREHPNISGQSKSTPHHSHPQHGTRRGRMMDRFDSSAGHVSHSSHYRSSLKRGKPVSWTDFVAEMRAAVEAGVEAARPSANSGVAVGLTATAEAAEALRTIGVNITSFLKDIGVEVDMDIHTAAECPASGCPAAEASRTSGGTTGPPAASAGVTDTGPTASVEQPPTVSEAAAAVATPLASVGDGTATAAATSIVAGGVSGTGTSSSSSSSSDSDCSFERFDENHPMNNGSPPPQEWVMLYPSLSSTSNNGATGTAIIADSIPSATGESVDLTSSRGGTATDNAAEAVLPEGGVLATVEGGEVYGSSNIDASGQEADGSLEQMHVNGCDQISDCRYPNALSYLLDMGYSNMGGWLTEIVNATEGDVNAALDWILAV
jgi:hypothetical protein